MPKAGEEGGRGEGSLHRPEKGSLRLRARFPAFAQCWLTQPWAFEPREETPPLVCVSAAWPTSGLQLAPQIQAPNSRVF